MAWSAASTWCFVLFQQVFHETVKVFIEVLKQFSRDDTRIIVNEM